MSEVVVPKEYWLEEFLKEHPPKPFRPIAYYDKRRDAITFKIRDCSVEEFEIEDYPFVLLIDNHPEIGQQKFIGFVIERAKDLLKAINTSKPEVLKNGVKILDVLKEMLNLRPSIDIEATTAQFIPFLRETELKVMFDER